MTEAEKTKRRKKSKSVLERIGRWLDKYGTQVNAVSAAIVAGATITLCVLTRYYLKETKRQRLLAQRSIELTQKAFEFESSAQPYIQNV